jgi:hypothetical protein
MNEELKALWVKYQGVASLESGVVVKNAEKEAKSESEETPKADTATA